LPLERKALICYCALENLTYDAHVDLPSTGTLGAYDAAFAQALADAERNKKYLAGWSAYPNSSFVTYTDEQSFEQGLTSTDGTTINLYAVFLDKETYAVTYNENTTEPVYGMPDDPVKAEGVELKLSETIPSRAGYNFLGWSTAADAAQAEYTAGATYGKNASLTLYAVWQAVGHTLSTYDNSVSSITVTRDGTELSSGAPLTYKAIPHNWTRAICEQILYTDFFFPLLYLVY